MSDAAEGRGSSVLCVDDEPEVLSALRRTFHREPFQVVTASDAASALASLNRDRFDVVIADERMPVVSGTELLAEARRRWPWIGSVILTGYPGHEVMRRGLEARVDFLLSKPWDDEALRRTISRLIREVERTRSESVDGAGAKPEFDLGGGGG